SSQLAVRSSDCVEQYPVHSDPTKSFEKIKKSARLSRTMLSELVGAFTAAQRRWYGAAPPRTESSERRIRSTEVVSFRSPTKVLRTSDFHVCVTDLSPST